MKDINILNSELREEAISNGLCTKWQGDWKDNWTLDKMAERYFRGIDFCYKNNYPTNEYFKKNFSKEFLREKGILVDEKYSLLNRSDCSIMGDTKAIIRTNGRFVCSAWVKDDAEISVYAKNFSNVRLHIFDSVQLDIEVTDNASVEIFIHSENCGVKYKTSEHGKVEIYEEYGYLGRNK